MYQQQIIGQNAPTQFNPMLNPIEQARTAGQITEYQFVNIKPKKKEKELIRVLSPEPKSFLFFKFGKKFNLKDRCVVCGMHHIWEAGDYLRPPIPLEKVVKGRPLKGTYCPKHASMFKQLEMLEQQILAEQHGLDFKAFKPRMPKALTGKPLTHLSKTEVASLTAAGYFIKPPTLQDNRSATNEAIELVGQINILTDRLNYLMIQNGVKAPEQIEKKEE
jgi:hypothetical protein|tara:strand:+ start:660 stop:1316 length:657 start_codon:yes stop_codon:yes gene_type:complete